MTIAIITNNFPPSIDGVGDYSFHLSTELQRRGHEVSIICRENNDTQAYINQGKFDFPVFATVPTWNWKAIHPLTLFLNRTKPDWFLIQYVPDAFSRWAMPIWLPIILFLIKPARTRICVTFHEVEVRMTYRPLKYFVRASIQRLVAFALSRLADVCVSSIDLYTNLLQKYTNDSIHLIPVGSNILPVPVSENEYNAIRQQIAPADEAVICTFGLRNQDMLLRTFVQVLSERQHTKLLIIGALRISEDAQALFNNLNQHIYITGYLESTDVFRYLSASDVFLLPDLVDSAGEGGTSTKSGSLAAALAAGLPIVGTKGDMNSRILRDCSAVALAPAIPDSLARELIRFIDSNRAYETEAKAFYQQYLAWPVIGKQYSDILMS